jgi:hypothetical protein
MRDKGKQSKWRVNTESIYAFGREERLQSAYESILPTEKIALKGREHAALEVGEDRTVCSSIE